MKIPLAWLNLWHDKARTAVALAGVAFAIVLILMQLGFLGSVQATATQVYDQLEFDILLVSPQYLYFSYPGLVPRTSLYQAASDEDVESVATLDVGFNLWRIPGTARRRGILVMAYDPSQQVFRPQEIIDQAELLTQPGLALMDRKSRREFGDIQPGLETEVGRRDVRIAGQFTMGTGFGADGAIIVGRPTFERLFPIRTPDKTNLGLVRLREGADEDQVAERLRAQLPDDVDVLTRREMERRERRHWVRSTSVGVIFLFGVIVAMMVGTAIVYQVLSSDIANRLPEYATLKAMGYGPRYLTRVVLQQAMLLAVIGYIPGLIVAQLIYWWGRQWVNIPIDMTVGRTVGVLFLSIVMCGISGLASLAKVHAADPADLF